MIQQASDPKANQNLLTQKSVTATSAPIPPAQEVEYYDRIMPGAADRIFALAENQQAHRLEQERKQLEINTKVTESNICTADSNIRAQDATILEIRRGQWMAFILGLSFLGITALLGLNGHEFAASALGLGGVAAVATVFIKVRKRQ
ncbi:DUF2335 domain-containing protein [Vreelandella populi]|uniref:DUF2335 domain-containing protein n=1 Tax=Vreelandella populi TaxID=2498858 RepID=UPI00200E50BB|nr:DUF2335 domain-containing protein [Halomonas populi]